MAPLTDDRNGSTAWQYWTTDVFVRVSTDGAFFQERTP